MSKVQQARQILGTINNIVESDEFQQFSLNASDFLSAREQGQSAGTQIAQASAALGSAAEVLNRTIRKKDSKGRAQTTNIISPVVVPKDSRSYGWVVIAFGMIVFAAFNILGASVIPFYNGSLFGVPLLLFAVGYSVINVYRNSFVMIPDGCEALITRFGKLEETVGAGRKALLNPWRKVGYIVDVTKEYPYNAPIREAPTANRIDASVDLFLQFKIENATEFIYSLGGARGFAEKLDNAISEVTRALIYEQKAEDIYDLVGETTQAMLNSLNRQFLPAVRFVNANITHAEPSSQEYRMDLASAEVIRVAKEAYTYQYELTLRKEQDEGDLNRELAGLRETLSDIRADIAKSQAEINTAREREINRANAYARQLMIEAESEAKANSALLEAQALDIRAVSSAYYPEILEYRYQQDVLSRLQKMSNRLPQVVSIGKPDAKDIDFMNVGRQMMGIQDGSLYTEADVMMIRDRMSHIVKRIRDRASEINKLDTVKSDEEAIAEEIIGQVGSDAGVVILSEEAK